MRSRIISRSSKLAFALFVGLTSAWTVSHAEEFPVVNNQVVFADVESTDMATYTTIGEATDVVHPNVGIVCCNIGSATGALGLYGAIGDSMPYFRLRSEVEVEANKCEIWFGGANFGLYPEISFFVAGTFNHWHIEAINRHAEHAVWRCRMSLK